MNTKQGVKPPTLGYPAVEELIETENFAAVNAHFEKAHHELAGLAAKKRGLKTSREAQKGLKAIERVMALFRELLELKYRLKEVMNQSPAKK